MKNFSELLHGYARHHTKRITKLTHFIGVPCIIVAIQMVLSWVHIAIFGFSVSIDYIILGCVILYYLFFDVILAIATGCILLLLTSIAELITANQLTLRSFEIFSLLFILGWVAQLLGHYYEGNKPAFMENLLHALVAPLFLIIEAKSYLAK